MEHYHGTAKCHRDIEIAIAIIKEASSEMGELLKET